MQERRPRRECGVANRGEPPAKAPEDKGAAPAVFWFWKSCWLDHPGQKWVTVVFSSRESTSAAEPTSKGSGVTATCKSLPG